MNMIREINGSYLSQAVLLFLYKTEDGLNYKEALNEVEFELAEATKKFNLLLYTKSKFPTYEYNEALFLTEKKALLTRRLATRLPYQEIFIGFDGLYMYNAKTLDMYRVYA
jgi:hypothetical protein